MNIDKIKKLFEERPGMVAEAIGLCAMHSTNHGVNLSVCGKREEAIMCAFAAVLMTDSALSVDPGQNFVAAVSSKDPEALDYLAIAESARAVFRATWPKISAMIKSRAAHGPGSVTSDN